MWRWKALTDRSLASHFPRDQTGDLLAQADLIRRTAANDHSDRRMVIASRGAVAGGRLAGLIYGVGWWADHQNTRTESEGTTRRAFFGSAATALRTVAQIAVPVAVLVLLVSGCVFCVALVVFRRDPHQGELPAEGSDRTQPRG